MGWWGIKDTVANWPGTVRVVSTGNLRLQKKPIFHGSEEEYWMQRSRQDWAEQVTDD